MLALTTVTLVIKPVDAIETNLSDDYLVKVKAASEKVTPREIVGDPEFQASCSAGQPATIDTPTKRLIEMYSLQRTRYDTDTTEIDQFIKEQTSNPTFDLSLPLVSNDIDANADPVLIIKQNDKIIHAAKLHPSSPDVLDSGGFLRLADGTFNIKDIDITQPFVFTVASIEAFGVEEINCKFDPTKIP